MSFGMWNASVPVFVNSLTNMREWLDKAAQEKDRRLSMERPACARYEAVAGAVSDGFGFGEERACPAHRHRGPVDA